MPYVTTSDGTDIYYQDWGNKDGKTVVLSHGWPLSSDNWENQMFFLANKGYRVIAHDRRGYGLSGKTWHGNDLDTFADDLRQLMEKLDLKDVMMAGHSTGGGEVARYLGKFGTSRVSKAVLVSAMTPFMLKTETNPGGMSPDIFDGYRAAIKKDRAQFFLDVPSTAFFGFNREGAKVSQGLIRAWFQAGMTASMKASYDCVSVWTDSDLREDLKKIDIPVLVLHGDDDQVVPIDVGGRAAMKYLKHGTLKEYQGAPHALPNILVDEVNQEFLNFLES